MMVRVKSLGAPIRTGVEPRASSHAEGAARESAPSSHDTLRTKALARAALDTPAAETAQFIRRARASPLALAAWEDTGYGAERMADAHCAQDAALVDGGWSRGET